MSTYFPEKTREDLLAELHAEIEDRSEYLKALVLSGSIRSGSGKAFDTAWGIGFRRAVAEMKRRTEDMERHNDQYEVRTGAAGFVQLFKNGKRVMPKNTTIRFNLRKEIK